MAFEKAKDQLSNKWISVVSRPATPTTPRIFPESRIHDNNNKRKEKKGFMTYNSPPSTECLSTL